MAQLCSAGQVLLWVTVVIRSVLPEQEVHHVIEMGDDKESGLKRFSRVPETYYREYWREWAKGYLFGLPDNVSPAKYGVRLKNLLDG